jgi:hypothetical protein
MEQTQPEKLFERKYKDKYVSVKDIYNNIKKGIRIKTKWSKRKNRYRTKQIGYSLFYAIVKKFFEILIRDLVSRKNLVHLPEKLGYVYIDKKKHKRPFHIRTDINESNKQGKLVRYKVPILDDYYYKIVWVRPFELSRCKIMPLTRFKKSINEQFKN